MKSEITITIEVNELSKTKLLLVSFALLFVKPEYKYIEYPKFRLKTTLKTMFNKQYTVSVDKEYFDGKFNPFYGK